MAHSGLRSVGSSSPEHLEEGAEGHISQGACLALPGSPLQAAPGESWPGTVLTTTGTEWKPAGLRVRGRGWVGGGS